jgi:hypothetical protein
MSPEQFAALLSALLKIADHKQAITESTDWPLLAAMVTMFGAVFMAMVGGMWLDLRSSFKAHIEDNTKQIDKIWTAMENCQYNCCPQTPKRRATDATD